MLLPILFAVTLASAPQPDCVALPTPAARLACGDPELLALAHAYARLSADLRAADRDYRAPDGGATARRVAACATRACVAEGYRDLLNETVQAYYADGVMLRVRGGRHYEVRQAPSLWNHLILSDLGDGWSLFWLDGGFMRGTGDDPDVRSGFDVGVVRLEGGQGSWRRDGANGFDFARRGEAWQVTQVGDCPCGNLVRLEGLHRPSRAPFPRD